MEGESGVTRSIIDELHFWPIQVDQMGGESGVTRSMIEELHSSYPRRSNGRSKWCYSKYK